MVAIANHNLTMAHPLLAMVTMVKSMVNYSHRFARANMRSPNMPLFTIKGVSILILPKDPSSLADAFCAYLIPSVKRCRVFPSKTIPEI